MKDTRIQHLLNVITELLNCTELNMDDMELHTIRTIEKAKNAKAHYWGKDSCDIGTWNAALREAVRVCQSQPKYSLGIEAIKKLEK